mmetsp:Transcript_108513/g.317477  ORF Transcript_108513/g.317477 Transcript_108513/m.317477 type:complete len:528 (+) Transcript_108513:169-1752(+)
MVHPPLKLTKNIYSVGIRWDVMDQKGIDLDLQAVVVDDCGLIVDAAYYNNPTVLDGAVGLSGDDQTGAGNGDDEFMWVSLKKLPQQVKLIIFVVAVYHGGHLRDVFNGQIYFHEEGRPLRKFKMEANGCDADMVAMMRREDAGSWELVELDEPADIGSHFLDILEPNIGDLIRNEIPHAPRYQTVTFEMQKGGVVPLPQTSAVKRLFVGIGGQLRLGRKEDVDIDVSAVLMDNKGNVIGAIDCDCESLYGVSHSGDRVAGEEECGDDEAISMDLSQVPPKVRCIFVVLTVSRGSFKNVRKAYARIVDQSGVELLRYTIEGGRADNALIVAELSHATDRRWGFQAIGTYLTTKSHTWRGAADQMKQIFRAGKKNHGDSPGSKDHRAKTEEGDPKEGKQQPVTAGEVEEVGTSATNEDQMDRTSCRSILSQKSSFPRQTVSGGLSSCKSVYVAGGELPIRSPSTKSIKSTSSRSPIKRGTVRLRATAFLADDTDVAAVDSEDRADVGPRSFACASCLFCTPGVDDMAAR